MDLDKLQYFPLALPHFSLLALIFLALVAWIEVQALRSAYLSMGLGPHAALLLLLASLAVRESGRSGEIRRNPLPRLKHLSR
jgi:hypothetical protein